MTLQVTALHKYFDGVRAVQGVSFAVEPGECVALIGPNGAGKSTTFACIAGQQGITLGDISWCGKSLVHLTPAQRLQCGIARTFQVARVFDALTVNQNVQLVTGPQRPLRMFKALDHDGLGDPMHLLERAGLLADAHRLAGELPYGAKKRLELAMALAGISRPTGAEGPSQAKLLLLDEPAAGLSSTERADLMQWVRSLSTVADEYACAVLYTEHNMDAVFGVADRVIVLIEGQIAAQGTPDEVARDPLVRSRYLGSSLHAIAGGKHA